MSSRKIKRKTHKPKPRGPRSGVRSKFVDPSRRFAERKQADETVKELMAAGLLSVDDICNVVKLGRVAREAGISQNRLSRALGRAVGK